MKRQVKSYKFKADRYAFFFFLSSTNSVSTQFYHTHQKTFRSTSRSLHHFECGSVLCLLRGKVRTHPEDRQPQPGECINQAEFGGFDYCVFATRIFQCINADNRIREVSTKYWANNHRQWRPLAQAAVHITSLLVAFR